MQEGLGRPGPAPLRLLAGETVVVDRALDRPVLRLGGVVLLPVGAAVDLPASPQQAVVVGVRLRGSPGPGDEAMTVWLEVDVPAGYWEGREGGAARVVPGPIATADLDLNPDAAAPLGTPLP